MDNITIAIEEYFTEHPIDVEQVKINYKERNNIKLKDDNKLDLFSIGVNLSRLYTKKLKTK